jgi:ribonucleotide reductase beta subunit family protein with ferritin-like domain
MLKQNFITKVLLKDGDNELSKDLKVKIVGMRVKMAKFKKEFDEDVQEVINNLKPENFDSLSQKENKTEEENQQLTDMVNKLNAEYIEYVNKRGMDEITYKATFTEDEINEIIEINAGNDVEINGNKLMAADFLEAFYTIFIEE